MATLGTASTDREAELAEALKGLMQAVAVYNVAGE